MRIALYAKEDAKSLAIQQALKQQLQDHNHLIDQENPDVIMTIGGDGTLLRTLHTTNFPQEIGFLGIHTGTLGFLTEAVVENLEKVLDALDKPLVLRKKHLLQAELFSQGKLQDTLYALNEFRVENIIATQEMTVTVNGEYLEHFRGNGMVVSSQLGSTAFNRSIGSAILDESVNAIILAEIAGIHHSHYRSLYSPLVLGHRSTIQFDHSSFEHAKLLYDHLNCDLATVDKIIIKESSRTVSFVQINHASYISRLSILF